MKKTNLLLMFALFVFISKSEAQDFREMKVFPSVDSLRKVIGQKTKMYVGIFDTKYDSKSNLTYLNVGDNYPLQVLTLIIKGDDRKKFSSPPEIFYKNKEIKVIGIPELVNDKLQVVIHDPSQLIGIIKVITNK